MKTVLTIAGFDPSSGAGVTADLMVFAAHGLNGTSAITALTVQSTAGVRGVECVDPRILSATLDCLEDDLPAHGIKIGMLGSEANVHAVCDYLRDRRAPGRPVVLDPVVRSSSGRELIDAGGLRAVRERLLPLVDWVTPNVDELAVLVEEDVEGRDDLVRAALELQTRYGGGLGVVVTGGHLDAPDDLVVLPGGEIRWIPGVRVETRATHGTGCALSSAFLARLVWGRTPEDAISGAKRYLEEAMARATEVGSGPCRMNHLWRIYHPEPE